MHDSAVDLPVRVSVTVRIDGSPVGVFETQGIGPRCVYLPAANLPLPEHSYVELEFPDGENSVVVPGHVTHVDHDEVTIEYEQTGTAFEHWRAARLTRT